MKSGLEDRNNTDLLMPASKALLSLNEVRPGRPEQSVVLERKRA